MIAITQRLSFVETYQEERESLDSQWYDFAQELADVHLLPISYKSDPGAFLDQFQVDCIVLSGGNDVYQHQRAPNDETESLSAKRDQFEKSLIAEAKLRNIRVLGICRGLQTLLLQYGARIAPILGHVGRQHALLPCVGQNRSTSEYALECCSLIFDEDGALKGNHVNSFHNYAPRITANIDSGVEVLAVPPEGDVIEAFVHRADGTAGIMWHPERSRGIARNRDISLVKRLLRLNESSVSFSTVPQKQYSNVRVVVLCAGQGTRLRPLTDTVPKCMVQYKGRAIIDYALSVYRLHGLSDVTLVTGYKASRLKRPGVKYVHNKHYATSNMVKSLFCALDTVKDFQKDLVVSYSDIIYTPDILGKLLTTEVHDSAVSVVIDKDWLRLWQSRMEDPLSDAETLKVDEDGYIVEIGKKPQRYDDIEGQYIGLMKFSASGVGTLTRFFRSLDVSCKYDGKSIDEMYMTTLLQLMIDSGIKVRAVFVNGGWTEIDCRDDLKVDVDFSMIPSYFRGQTVNFGTKAETLHALRDINVCRTLPLVYFTQKQWQNHESRERLVTECLSMISSADMLIVRSSAASEDSLESSAAGLHDTYFNVHADLGRIHEAVLKVFASYRIPNESDQVLIQPMLQHVAACGVICTTELQDYMPYFVLSYEESGRTDTVTSGSRGNIKTMYVSKCSTYPQSQLKGWQKEILETARCLEENFQNDKLDIEFAVNADGLLYVLQVRPVVVPSGMPKMLQTDFVTVLKEVQADLELTLGDHELLDNMMDWNPAEMIGVAPSPLARSLYELLITDEVAMKSRAVLGYRDVSNEPLMCTIGGRPFIRASISFESFIPASLETALAKKLVHHYLSMLRQHPEKRDKVEFEIVFSCFEPDLSARLQHLSEFGFTTVEQDEIKGSLLELTNGVLHRVEDDLATVNLLPLKVSTIQLQELKDPTSRLLHIVEYVKTFGTLPFSNLARCAFVAVSLLKSLQRSGHLEEITYNEFMESLHTIGKELGRDLVLLQRSEMTKKAFLSRYGHLRPGTYDICTPRYDEDFDLYFSDIGTKKSISPPPLAAFQLDDRVASRITSRLHECGLTIDCRQLFEFCRKSIEGREKAKFIFSAAVSDILVEVTKLGESLNIHRFDMSFLNIKSFLQKHENSMRDVWENILHNRHYLGSVSKLKLPVTIRSANEVWAYEETTTRPNFVTKKEVTGDVVTESNLFHTVLDEKIIVVESADPGWDWLFSNSIRGLITCYGGANSHMAIRAAELSLPAAIGVGISKFESYTKSRRLKIDARAQTITMLH